MRVLIIRIFFLVLLGCSFILLTGAFSPASLMGRGADVDMDYGTCTVFGENGTPETIEGQRMSVLTGTNEGTGTVRCQGWIENSSGRAIMHDYGSTGMECFSSRFGTGTSNWMQITSSSGEVTLICHFKKE